MTPSTKPRTRPWLARAFVQPLLVTILGIWVAPALVLFAWSASVGPRGEPSPCTGECGTAQLADGLLTGIRFLLGWVVEVVIVGFIVGRSSRDARLALRAVLVGVVLPPIAVAILLIPGAIARGDDVLFAILSTLVSAALFGLVVTMPTAFGFWLGGLARPNSRDRTTTEGTN